MPLPGQRVEIALDGLLGAPPQFPSAVVPHDVAVVVVAVQAERLSELRITGAMPDVAGQDVAMVACGLVAAGMAGCSPACAAGRVRAGTAADYPVVDEAEGRGGEGGEHGGMRGYLVRDAMASGQARADHLVGVLPVGLGTRGTDGRAAVAARLVDHPVGQVLSGDIAEEFTGGEVDVPDGAVQPNRASASGRRPDVIEPGIVVTASGAGKRGLGSTWRDGPRCRGPSAPGVVCHPVVPGTGTARMTVR